VAEFSVQIDANTTRCYTLTVDHGSVTIGECASENADVRVSGTQADWIDALGPEADHSGLLVDGDERLATALLDGVGSPLERVRAA
jgi:hypothetical protein